MLNWIVWNQMKPVICVQKNELRLIEKCYLQNVFRNVIFDICIKGFWPTMVNIP